MRKNIKNNIIRIVHASLGNLECFEYTSDSIGFHLEDNTTLNICFDDNGSLLRIKIYDEVAELVDLKPIDDSYLVQSEFYNLNKTYDFLDGFDVLHEFLDDFTERKLL